MQGPQGRPACPGVQCWEEEQLSPCRHLTHTSEGECSGHMLHSVVHCTKALCSLTQPHPSAPRVRVPGTAEGELGDEQEVQVIPSK